MDKRDIKVFSKEWFAYHQNKLVWLANTAYGKSLMGFDTDHKVFEVYPNGVICDLGNNKYFFELRTHEKIGKQLYYNLKPLWKAFHWFDLYIANKVNYNWNLGFDSFGPFFPDGHPESATVDGYVARLSVNETFPAIIAGAGTAKSDGAASTAIAGPRASGTASRFDQQIRAIFLYDTSSIGASATIDSATLSLYLTIIRTGLGSNSYDVVASAPASNLILANADYGTLGSASFSNATPTVTGSYTDWSFNASGNAAVDTVGISKFGVRDNWDLTGIFDGVWSSGQESRIFGNYAETVNEPKLAGTFTMPTSRDRLIIIS